MRAATVHFGVLVMLDLVGFLDFHRAVFVQVLILVRVQAYFPLFDDHFLRLLASLQNLGSRGPLLKRVGVLAARVRSPQLSLKEEHRIAVLLEAWPVDRADLVDVVLLDLLNAVILQ